MDLAVIQTKIYEIRGERVMLDRDLAELYQVETRILNQAAKRNMDRFPNNFKFQLTDEKFGIWESQFVITNSIKQGLRHNPYAFTEQGVAMLSGVLRSEVAVWVSIRIMNAFVAMRRYLSSVAVVPPELSELKKRMEMLERNTDGAIVAVNDVSEDIQKELNDIYLAVAELPVRSAAGQIQNNKIGYEK